MMIHIIFEKDSEKKVCDREIFWWWYGGSQNVYAHHITLSHSLKLLCNKKYQSGKKTGCSALISLLCLSLLKQIDLQR